MGSQNIPSCDGDDSIDRPSSAAIVDSVVMSDMALASTAPESREPLGSISETMFPAKHAPRTVRT
jgi:hypothetical protein